MRINEPYRSTLASMNRPSRNPETGASDATIQNDNFSDHSSTGVPYVFAWDRLRLL